MWVFVLFLWSFFVGKQKGISYFGSSWSNVKAKSEKKGSS